MNRFTASYSTLVKIISSSVIIAMCSIAVFVLYMEINAPSAHHLPVYLISILLIATSVVPYILSTTSYTIIDDESLIINKVIGAVIIPIKDIASIDIIEPKLLWLSIRLFGSGGLFGYFGIFYNKSYGRMRWYATQRKNCLVIITHSQKKYLITPDDMNGILNLLPKEKIQDKRIV